LTRDHHAPRSSLSRSYIPFTHFITVNCPPSSSVFSFPFFNNKIWAFFDCILKRHSRDRKVKRPTTRVKKDRSAAGAKAKTVSKSSRRRFSQYPLKFQLLDPLYLFSCLARFSRKSSSANRVESDVVFWRLIYIHYARVRTLSWPAISKREAGLLCYISSLRSVVWYSCMGWAGLHAYFRAH
jgi:hypothetical protein